MQCKKSATAVQVGYAATGFAFHDVLPLVSAHYWRLVILSGFKEKSGKTPEWPVWNGSAAAAKARNEPERGGGRLLVRRYATVIGHDHEAVDAVRVCPCR